MTSTAEFTGLTGATQQKSKQQPNSRIELTRAVAMSRETTAALAKLWPSMPSFRFFFAWVINSKGEAGGKISESAHHAYQCARFLPRMPELFLRWSRRLNERSCLYAGQSFQESKGDYSTAHPRPPRLFCWCDALTCALELRKTPQIVFSTFYKYYL